MPGPRASWSAATYAALFVLVAVWAALLRSTWATWGDLTVDSGHEMYIPTMLAAGKMLYKDVWFLYGPAAPYFNSYLFRLFGVHLNVLYWAGSLAALGSAIFLYLSGMSLGSWLVGWTAGAVVLIEAFEPGLFCFPLPYTFSSVYGCLSACIFLWLVIQATRSGRWVWMLGAGTVVAVALLLKLEFGAACYGTVLLLMVAESVRQRSWKPMWTGMGATLPGFVVCAWIVRWMVSIGGVDFITQQNLMSWPTSYFMRVYGKFWLANTGFNLSAHAFLSAAGRISMFAAAVMGFHLLLRRKGADGSRGFLIAGSALAVLDSIFFVVILPGAMFLNEHALLAAVAGVLFLAGIAVSVHFLLRRKGNIGWLLLIFGLGAAAMACLAPIFFLQGVLLLRRIFFPQDAVLIVAIAAVICWGYGYRRGSFGSGLTLAILFTFPALLAFRVLMGMQPHGYSIFYNGPAVLALLFLASRLIGRQYGPGAKVDFRAELVVCGCCLLWVMTPQRIFVDRYKNLAPLVTERGVVWAPQAKVAKYQEAIAFMKEKAAAGESVLSIPEDTSLYFLSGTVCPTRAFQFTPGVLVPGKMTEGVINEIEQKRVRYLLWSNRTSEEYGARVFGKDYDAAFAGYLTSHYRRLGPLGKNDEPGWSAVVWERISAEVPQ